MKLTKLAILFLPLITFFAQANKYSVMGVDSDNQVESFFLSIQEDIKSGNIKLLSEKIAYPLNIFTEKEKLQVQSKQQFIANYSQFMTHDLKTALLCQTTNDLRANSNGLRAARGAIWMNLSFIGKPDTFDDELHKKGLDGHMWQLRVTKLSNRKIASMAVQDCEKRVKSAAKN